MLCKFQTETEFACLLQEFRYRALLKLPPLNALAILQILFVYIKCNKHCLSALIGFTGKVHKCLSAAILKWWIIYHDLSHTIFKQEKTEKLPEKNVVCRKKLPSWNQGIVKKFNFHHTTLTDPTSKANYLRLNKGSSLFIVYPWDQTGLHFLLYNENEMQQKLIREYSMIYCLINRYKDYWQKTSINIILLEHVPNNENDVFYQTSMMLEFL